MLKGMLLSLVFCLFISTNANSSVTDVKYGEYIKCYYEILQASHETVIKTQSSVTLMPKEIKSFKPEHDFYTFTSEGFYAGKATEQIKKASACGRSRGDDDFEVSVDFFITTDGKKIPLCFYSKDIVLLQPNDKLVNQCTEVINDGNCDDNINTAHSANTNISIKPLFGLSVKETTKLDSKYFYQILYPMLQKMFEAMSKDVLWNNFWTDSPGGSKWRYEVLDGKIETLSTCKLIDSRTNTKIIVVPKR